jgi:PD-(D/E)XK nuclease superfamily
MPRGELPLVRHSERVDYKRCIKKWYWHWREGLFTKNVHMALELGTWMHEALARFYSGTQEGLAGYFIDVTDSILQAYEGPEHIREQLEELIGLGIAMATAYDKRYADEHVDVIAAELPLEFPIKDEHGNVVAIHKLKPDLVYRDANGDVWLMEHKTAKQIRLEHLPIDDQARPYAAMAEVALRRAGFLTKEDNFKGVMYNFLRKALPDEREHDAQGRYLNKNGTVSKRQPTPTFLRHPVTLTRQGKQIALMRLRVETEIITGMTKAIRDKTVNPFHLPKTPHSSCPKLCDYFAMCVVEEQGGNVQTMKDTMYYRQNPYLYDEETTDIPASFELS